jgi:hypothetical protein
MSTLEHATEQNSGEVSTMPSATIERTTKHPVSAEQAVRESVTRAHLTDAERTAHSSNEQPVDEVAATIAAIRRAVGDARSSVGTAVDPRIWTKKSPWIALGLASTTGLVAAVCLRRGAKPETSKHEPPQPQPPKQRSEEPAKAGWTGSIANSLFDLAKVAVETAIMTSIREASGRHFDDRGPSEEIVNHAE